MARQKQQGKSRKPSQGVSAPTQEFAMTATRESQGSFVDALNATQQHTVPILPAYDAPRPRQANEQPSESPPSPATRATASPRTSYAKATLAPGVGGLQRTGSHSGASTPASGVTTDQALAQQHAPMQRTTASPLQDTMVRKSAKGGSHDNFPAESLSATGAVPTSGFAGWRHADALSTNIDTADNTEEDDADLSLVPGRPTFVLPVVTGERLPAVRPPLGERQIAVREMEEPRAVFIRGASKLPVPYVALAPRRQGPRPFIVQFLVAMVTVMTLFAVLTLASPLGKSLAFSNSFQAYANAMPWIPTPTPTPKPTPAPQFYGQQPGVNPGQQVIINTINAVFGPYAGGALNIARCESGYDPNAYNSYPVAGSHAEGVFQILYPSTWSGTSYVRYSPYDYNANIRAAYEIFHNDGNSWREWECQP